jgi:hypothetical protein
MAWTENNDIGNTSSNEDGLNIDSEGIITSDELDDEGIEFKLSIDDLIDNPYRTIISTDPVSGKIPIDLIPSFLIGKLIFKNTILEMLSINYGDTPPGGNNDNYLNRGQICIVKEVRSSFMLVGANPSILSNWAELVAKYTSWENIQNKPLEFPPEDHDHDDIYARLVNGKIPARYLRSLQLGDRFTANDLGEMLDLPARSGDVCTRRDERKLYLLAGINGLLPDGYSNNWIEIPSPLASVTSINGYNGIVFLDYTDVGAAAKDHQHEVTELIDIANPGIKYSLKKMTDGKLAVYENGDFLFNLGESGKVKTIADEDLEFIFSGGFLFYRINGGSPLPFA